MLVNELHQGGTRALLDYDNTLFDDMQLPSDLDTAEMRRLIIDDIVIRHGDQPLQVPDPVVMKYYIKNWSMRMKPLWQRFYNACMAEYDPIENYNRIEHRLEKRRDTMDNTRTLDTQTDTTGTETTEETVSAENVVTYSPESMSTRTSNLNMADSGTIEDDGCYNGDLEVDGTIHGNIGVTTSQQMLESEIALIPKLDFIKYISDSYQAEFCLMIY